LSSAWLVMDLTDTEGEGMPRLKEFNQSLTRKSLESLS